MVPSARHVCEQLILLDAPGSVHHWIVDSFLWRRTVGSQVSRQNQRVPDFNK
jgi:hypothetical protein